MNLTTIHGTVGAFSASEMLEAVGDRLTEIKRGNGLTWADVGATFGKSDDVAASYAAGLSDMPLSAWVRGVRGFGPAFGDVAASFAGFRLCRIGTPDLQDRHMPRPLGELSCKLMRAIEDGTKIEDDELRDAAPELLAAGVVLDALRDRLAQLGIGGDL